MGSTSALCSSRASGPSRPSTGPSSPVSQPHGRRRGHVPPCERNDAQKAENSNQRTYSSPVSSLVGKKPPVSLPQNGDRLREWFCPTDTCAASVAQRLSTSPDQNQ